MLRRLALVFLLLSLPLRLWAGAGMLVSMSGFEASPAVAHASMGMPACHEMPADGAAEPVQSTQVSGHGTCHTCQLCYWAVLPQMDLVPSLTTLPIRYASRLNAAMTSADLARQIKPPISLS